MINVCLEDSQTLLCRRIKGVCNFNFTVQSADRIYDLTLEELYVIILGKGVERKRFSKSLLLKFNQNLHKKTSAAMFMTRFSKSPPTPLDNAQDSGLRA